MIPNWSLGRKLVASIGLLNIILLVVSFLLFTNPAHFFKQPLAIGTVPLVILTCFFINGSVFLGCSAFWKHGKNLLLFYFSVIVFGTLCDRALNIFVYGSTSDGYIQPHPVYHHALKPGYYRTRFWPDYDEKMYVNSFGMRNREITKNKPHKCLRIAVLGDSFCMGKGVPDDKVFSVLLENKLNRSQPDASGDPIRYEVLNFAVDSYVPLLEFLQFRHQVMKFIPDLVLQFYDISDLKQEDALRNSNNKVVQRASGKDMIVAIHGTKNRPAGLKTAFLAGIDTLFQYRLYFISIVYRKLDHELNREHRRRVFEEYGRYLIDYTFESDQGTFDRQWQQIFESVRRTQQLCRQNGISYFLVAYPWKHQLPGYGNKVTCWWSKWKTTENRAPFVILYRFAKQEDIGFLDLYEGFRNDNGAQELYFNNDVHFTIAGHQLLAELLYRKLANIP